MTANPYDPLKRTDLSRREQILLRFTAEVLHGTNTGLIDTLVAPDYLQHTHGVGQGREGIRKYIAEIASRRPGREQRQHQDRSCAEVQRTRRTGRRPPVPRHAGR